jgi:hypothetical protein
MCATIIFYIFVKNYNMAYTSVAPSDSLLQIRFGEESRRKQGQREKNLIFDFFCKKIKNQIFLSLAVFASPRTLFVLFCKCF